MLLTIIIILHNVGGKVVFLYNVQCTSSSADYLTAVVRHLA